MTAAVQYSSESHVSDLAHGLGVGDGGGEVAIVVKAAEEAAPAVVPIGRVRQAPGHQRLPLITCTSTHTWSQTISADHLS